MEYLNHFEKLESYVPLDLLSVRGFLLANMVILGFVCLRYFLIVFVFYWLFWQKHLGKNRLDYLHDQKVKSHQFRTEIQWSLSSSFVFALSGYILGIVLQLEFSQIYLRFNEYPLWYLPLSFAIYTLIHEAYFYWTHVWMHKPKIFKKVHAIHHISVKTSPWASFSFHPYEATIHAFFLPLLVCIIPIHPVVILLYLIFMTVTAISNHLGVEILFPKVLRKFFISGTHHALHHEKFRYNYGLYYRFMDRWMGTEQMESK